MNSKGLFVVKVRKLRLILVLKIFLFDYLTFNKGVVLYIHIEAFISLYLYFIDTFSP